jgi:dimethylamine monooxygenase subunit B
VSEHACSDTMRLTVAAVTALTADVREFVLVAADGPALPSYPPGSHVAVECNAGRRNSYSLTGPGLEPDHYAISVRLDPEGRGGSRWLHEVALGQTLSVSPPRSDFAPVLSARHHVFVAGGIGITPVLAHVRAAVAWGRSFEVHYAARPGQVAHRTELQALCGGRLSSYPGRAALWVNLAPALQDRPLGTHLYTCGPASMIDEVAERAAAAGWPEQRVHAERFAAADPDPGTPFAAKLGRSGMLVPVGPGVTLLDALLAKGINVANLCRQGLCGECRLPVRSGGIDHRDHYLSDDERAAGDSLMACVSRAEGDLLELEI